jgi:hypothetical protein
VHQPERTRAERLASTCWTNSKQMIIVSTTHRLRRRRRRMELEAPLPHLQVKAEVMVEAEGAADSEDTEAAEAVVAAATAAVAVGAGVKRPESYSEIILCIDSSLSRACVSFAPPKIRIPFAAPHQKMSIVLILVAEHGPQ